MNYKSQKFGDEFIMWFYAPDHSAYQFPLSAKLLKQKEMPGNM
jgi:hypothetical protein